MSARAFLRWTGVLAGLLVACAGCRTARTDLSAPCDWRELDGAGVRIAGRAGDALPIVTVDSNDCRMAAMALSRIVEMATGMRPEVLVERAGQDCRIVKGLFIGDVAANRGWTCPLATASPAAFRVVVADGCVRFLGRADYAVYDWCERILGARVYCAEGWCVEPAENLVAPALDYSDRPVFAHRVLGSCGDRPWVRFAKAGSEHRGGVNVHAPQGWYADAGIRAAWPGIFETGETPMLCYGNPLTLAYYKRRIDRQIAGEEDSGGIVDTARRVVTVSQWDAPLRCRCAHCRGLYDPSLGAEGEASPIIWGRFLTGLSAWLAQAHPDYEISFLPYLNTCRAPRVGGRWLENAEAEVCTMPGLALLKERDVREREEGILREWQEATGRKVLNWHYGCWPQEWTSAPYVFGRTIREHYAGMRSVSCGSFVCAGDDDPRLALSLYVWMRCLWNPDIDVEAVYDGFARRMFGPAARPMRALIALQEAGWERPWDGEACTFRNIRGISYPHADVARMRELLDAARRLAGPEGTARRRVDWYASGFARFFREAQALGPRPARRTVALGVPARLVDAREVDAPAPRAGTTVTTAVADGRMRLTVRCEDPAAARMDFAHMRRDFVWGNDCVFVAIDDGGKIRQARIYLTGERDPGDGEFESTVSHDETGWTVTVVFALSAQARAKGWVNGNVCRWRVGDSRFPERERQPGSIVEHSRLGTCYTVKDDDPAAFCRFLLRPAVPSPI